MKVTTATTAFTAQPYPLWLTVQISEDYEIHWLIVGWERSATGRMLPVLAPHHSEATTGGLDELTATAREAMEDGKPVRISHIDPEPGPDALETALRALPAAIAA